MTEEEIQAIKEKDMKEYSEAWDNVKGFVLRRGEYWPHTDCKGLVWGAPRERENFKGIDELHNAIKKQKNFNYFFFCKLLNKLSI